MKILKKPTAQVYTSIADAHGKETRSAEWEVQRSV
jgi:hypothetical protein